MVLDAAVRVFNRCGYEASSMNDIARATGLSKSSLYHHVASKEELLERALERAFTPLLAVFEEPAALSGSAVERLRVIIDRVTSITLEHVHEVELLQRVKGNTRTEREALRRRQKVDSAVRAIVEEAIRSGDVRTDLDPSLVTRLIFGMSNSVTQWYRADGKLTPQAIARAVSAIVFEGIARRS
ncbi:MAG TPA: TetR/AcrR family transcriptional regulator [Candidatus Binataceae bacterium]|jgi:AcrR family transcriptional regulator|nr:TetR/AcrR family transcriptional regulator [Candidatus Binataceae bacterium]